MNYFGVMEKYGIGTDALKKLMKLAGYDNFKTKKFTSGELAHLSSIVGTPNVSYSVGGKKDNWYVLEILHYSRINGVAPGKKFKGYISYFGAYDAMTELMEIADIERVRNGTN